MQAKEVPRVEANSNGLVVLSPTLSLVSGFRDVLCYYWFRKKAHI